MDFDFVCLTIHKSIDTDCAITRPERVLELLLPGNGLNIQASNPRPSQLSGQGGKAILGQPEVSYRIRTRDLGIAHPTEFCQASATPHD